jgi:hypothetical protein
MVSPDGYGLSQPMGQRGNHTPARVIKNEEPELWNNAYLKFATIRNPWEVEVSSFFYKMSKTVVLGHPEVHLKTSLNGFAGFLKAGGIRPMIDFLVDENNEIMVDEILRVENLKQDLDKMCEKYNLELFKKLEKANDTSHLNYKDYYKEQWMIDFVYKKNESYIKHFKYKFENEN